MKPQPTQRDLAILQRTVADFAANNGKRRRPRASDLRSQIQGAAQNRAYENLRKEYETNFKVCQKKLQQMDELNSEVHGMPPTSQEASSETAEKISPADFLAPWGCPDANPVPLALPEHNALHDVSFPSAPDVADGQPTTETEEAITHKPGKITTVRLSGREVDQIKFLQDRLGLRDAQIIRMAIARLYNIAKAEHEHEQAIARKIDGRGH